MSDDDHADPDPDIPIVLPLASGELDLHTFAPRDVASVVEEFVIACQAAGVLRLRIVHGRGKGVQRAIVHTVLARLPAVRSASDADPAEGGWGATVVHLFSAGETGS